MLEGCDDKGFAKFKSFNHCNTIYDICKVKRTSAAKQMKDYLPSYRKCCDDPFLENRCNDFFLENCYDDPFAILCML